ncbi:MAG TPA: BamA/TamA family outer membrane protein, partial [Chitinophagaceae bacterium]
VSGGGCKTNRVSESRKSLFVDQQTGFAVMEVSKNKNVTVTFYTVTDSVRNAYHTTILNFSAIPEPALDTTKRIVDVPKNVKYNDTITITASDKYPPIKGLRKFIMGQNYRPEWSTPVNMKVFNINKEKGGFRILSLGGGKQTKSLRLRDKQGKEWVLRAIDKNPTKALPENFRNTLAQDVVQEFNSAAHPYAALTIPSLAAPLNIAVPHPELFFVPDDPAFGFYQPLFANTVCMLEEREPSWDGTETKSTIKVFNKLIEENDHRADQQAVLRARLLDILIADFDRHFDQWKWATNDTGKGKIYYPIPRDRDQAFFYSDGRLIKAASRNMLPFLIGFRKDIPKVNWLGFSAKDFDRLFLTDLDAKEWKEIIAEVQDGLADSVITQAIKKLPPEVYGINGKTITEKLISRRNALPKAAMQYYRFISRKVNVVGSNQKEYFRVSSDSNGLNVRVYAREKGNDTSFIMYNRTFQFSTTDELRLYGLNDDDLFEIDENAKSRIKIRIIGGRGNDTFNVRSNIRALLYDMNVEGNYIKSTGGRTKNRFSKDPPVNSYSLLGFQYNRSKFPQVEIGANSDDGFIVGAGFSRRTYGFRNEPYASEQSFAALYSLDRNAYRFRYQGEFNHFSRDLDLLVKADFGYPLVANFFGLGNETEKLDEHSYKFYRSRYRTLEMEALIRRRVFSSLSVMAGPYFFHYWSEQKDNVGKILENPALVGLDPANVFSLKTYLGLKAAMRFDNRNNEIFPTRGVLWNNELISAFGMNKSSNNYYRLSSDMTIYASLTDPAKVVAVLGLGGGKIFTNRFEYFQAMSLGNNFNLHGFRKNRYLGRSSAYGSLELRVKLFDIKSYLIPGAFGLTGFYDIGRVWLKEEDSRKWHSAFGGGFYFMPFNLFVITGSVGFSKGERLLNFTFGTKVNLRF